MLPDTALRRHMISEDRNNGTEPSTTGGAANLGQKLRGLLTFTDLPIKRKFLLFAGSTMLWFVLMSAVAVISMTAIHYQYYQVAEQVIPYRQTIVIVLARLNDLDGTLRQAYKTSTGQADFSGFDASRKQLEGIRAAISDLTLHQNGQTGNGINIVEQVINNMAKANPAGMTYLQKMLTLTTHIDSTLDIYQQKKGVLTPAESYKSVQGDIAQAIALSGEHLKLISADYQAHNRQIYGHIKNAVNVVIGVLIIASLLLVLFTHWIIVAFHQPIKAIIRQIDSLSTGDIDLAKKVSITSKDEIGTLSRKFNHLMEAVYSMTVFKKVIEEDTSLDEVYRRLGEVFVSDIGIDDYTIFEVNPLQKEIKPVYPPLVGDTRLHCYEDILTDCNNCRAVKSAHKISSFEFSGICRYFVPEEGIGHICVPIMLGGNTGAVVQFRFPIGEQQTLSGADTSRLFKAETYLNQSLSVLEAKRLMQTLRDSALVDPLTGLYNRRFLQEHTKQIIAGVLRRDKQIGLLVCDLDYFKQVNDTHGHDVGDQMLKATANVLKTSVREADLVIRFGGEEFLVLLLDVDESGAMIAAEKIRTKMEEFKLKVGNVVLQKSISIGASVFPGDTDGFWQAIKYADVALYRAKETGRNRAVRFTPDMWQHGDF